MSNPNVWLEYEDDEGRKYYYNEASEETAWEVPEGAIIKNPDEVEEEVPEEDQGQSDNNDLQYDDTEPQDASPEPDQEDGNVSMEEQPDETNNEPVVPDDTNNKETMEQPADATDEPEAPTDREIEWIRYQDDEGRDYFYNSVTGVTQWEEPEKFMEPPEEEEDTEQTYEQDATDEPPMDEQDATPVPEDDDQQPTSPSHEYTDEPMNEPVSPQRSPSPEPSPQEPEEPPKDPEQVALENADAFISKPDSVMEADVTSHFFKLFQSNGPEAATKLVASFTNQPAICGILSKWLIDMKQANESSVNSLVDKFDIQKLHTAHTHEVKNLMENIIAKTAKQNFTDEAQQTIFNLSKRERMFFEEMMEHERWRRLLIDLSAEHPDSALLTLLLQNISKRGYHREIAKRINQSDYFEVFHGMLSSELTLLAKLAINGGKDTTAELELVDCADTIVNDLKRQSTTTAYTYIYAIELLDELIARSKVKAKSMSGPKALGLQRATRKWERIQEEMTQHIVKPKDNDDSNPLTKKRKVDVAVMSSESNQKQRRTFRNDTSGQDQTAKIRHISHSFETGLLEALVYYARNSTVDSKLLDKLLYNPNLDNSREGKTKQGKLLLQHPLVLEYLLKSLFLRKNRSKSEDVKRKCSKLLAMAALAAERELNGDESLQELTEDDEKKKIEHFTNIIMNGSKLCEKLDTIVTIVASDEISGDTSNLSVGAQLSSSCMQSSIVAQGFLLWAKERVSNSEFPNTAAYPGTAPGILSLTRIIVNHHPLLRKPAIDIAFNFLHHSSSELGFQKMNTIKEQALRLLLIISTKGLATDVFVVFKATLTSGSNIDSGLVRYFVAGCLDIMKPPISLGIVRAFGGLLLLPQCIEALKTNYFDTRKKQKLSSFLQYVEDAVASDSSQFMKSINHDRSISTSLKVAYAFS